VTESAKVALSGNKNPLLDISVLSVYSEVFRYLVAFIVSGLVFAAISTTNTFLTVCSSSFTVDILVGSVINQPLAKLRPSVDELFVGVFRAVIVGIVALILICFVVFVLEDLLRDPFRFFFIAYSVQFALLPSVITSVLPNYFRPSSISVLASLAVGFTGSLFLGFGAWVLSQARTEPLLSIPPSDWLPLAPVLTVTLGFIPLLFSAVRRWLSVVLRKTYLARRLYSALENLRRPT
jgi:hypothetical protein